MNVLLVIPPSDPAKSDIDQMLKVMDERHDPWPELGTDGHAVSINVGGGKSVLFRTANEGLTNARATTAILALQPEPPLHFTFTGPVAISGISMEEAFAVMHAVLGPIGE